MNKEDDIFVFTIGVPTNLVTKEVTYFEHTCANMVELYAKKNHDYGDSFNKGMKDIGLAYGIGRLYDKMNRIVNLLKVDAEIKDESIKDTLLDLACYAIMNYNFITGDKTVSNDKNKSCNIL